MSAEASQRASAIAARAIHLMPAFRDKFDFSSPENYADMAKMAFLAAEAFVAKEDALMIAAQLAADIAKAKEASK